jgi:hypothetical protein
LGRTAQNCRIKAKELSNQGPVEAVSGRLHFDENRANEVDVPNRFASMKIRNVPKTSIPRSLATRRARISSTSNCAPCSLARGYRLALSFM